MPPLTRSRTLASTRTSIRPRRAGTIQTTTSLTSPGVLRSTATQDEPQTQHADTDGGLTQEQQGPEFCCAEQNGGTAANFNLVTQSNVQNQTPGSGTSVQSTFQIGTC